VSFFCATRGRLVAKANVCELLGPKGFITADLIKQHVAPPSLSEKVKVFVCGMSDMVVRKTRELNCKCEGPPGQVAAVAGQKAGMKQGELGGILKQLGYTEDQVCTFR